MIVYQDTQRRPVTPRRLLPFGLAVLALALTSDVSTDDSRIGREVSVAQHLADGEEFQISLDALFDHGKKLFTADWTSEEGGGRPLTKGNGKPLSDLSTPGRCRVVLDDRRTVPCYRDYINRWRRRFLAKRLEGLRPQYRGQPPTVLTPQMEARILERTRQPPPDGSTHWSTRKLGRLRKVHHNLVGKAWRRAGLTSTRIVGFILAPSAASPRTTLAGARVSRFGGDQRPA
jgi:Homeodomain-like domain